MFRKRKDNEGATGINRISRLIEQRQREAADEGDDDAMLDNDDTILMPRSAPTSDVDEEDEGVSAVSLIGIRSTANAEPAPQREPEPMPQPEAETVAMPVAEQEPAEQVSAFAQQAYGTATQQPWEAEPEPEPEAEPAYTMPVPNIGAASVRGTLVAADAEWEGKLIAQGDVRVEGVLRGEIETTGTLVVAPQAQVHGIVRAREIVLGGDVEGEVSCEQRLEILPGGSARGQINSGTLVVHEGAYIDSRFQMRRADAGAS